MTLEELIGRINAIPGMRLEKKGQEFRGTFDFSSDPKLAMKQLSFAQAASQY